jgi:hypothetical protein
MSKRCYPEKVPHFTGRPPVQYTQLQINALFCYSFVGQQKNSITESVYFRSKPMREHKIFQNFIDALNYKNSLVLDQYSKTKIQKKDNQ